MLVPRRVRRRLTCWDMLPSGWFAVWFLMLLGFCKVGFPEPPESPETGILWPTPIGGSCDGGMLRLTLLPLNPDSAERRQIGIPYKTPAELDTIRPWHEVEFTGRAIDDFIAFERVIQSVKAVQSDTSHEGGIRIRFRRHATFSSLVAALDVMAILNSKRYWLDTKHKPLTLYVITNKPEHNLVQPIFL
ncbi:hypothetical protein [Hymenobacter psoromatis]|uniref:hypothetical protein n=1 Tax=Hymenobacter psoromatis TaxID=1484116 RepID=UPI001CC0D19D|nr:hypothetical protein [Hymenobacter psoromatis]